VKGWWYYTGVTFDDKFTSDALTACKLTAQNHAAAPLVAMRPVAGSKGNMMECRYALLGMPKDGQWYGTVSLFCKPGYEPGWPGVCAKRKEAPAPVNCSSECAGYATGNPVQVASGAKVQTETDLVAAPGKWLRITRTYRSLRSNWRAQSAAFGSEPNES
jgi:hypothetical protein